MTRAWRRAAPVLGIGLLFAVGTGPAHGVTGYLPMNLDPLLQYDIERVLLLADEPVMTRPVAVSRVQAALPAACAVDRALCERVGRELGRYATRAAITHLRVEGAGAGGADRALPNRHGLPIDSAWQVSASAHLQVYDWLRVNLGGVAWDGDEVPLGTGVSVGVPWAQLDVGWRGHWLSPFTDGAMLLSTQAQPMPSATLSNPEPLTRWGVRYELFVSRMSSSDRIRFGDGFTSGYPRLAGASLSIEPFSGWSLGVNRIMQYGGGERGGDSFGDAVRAFFQPSKFSNIGETVDRDEAFGNQAASFTSRFLFPGRTPFAVFLEYAGEDTSAGRDYLLGNSALSVGVQVPQLWRDFEFTWEATEWQNAWYVHGTYLDGLVHEDRIIGHWAGDERAFGDGVGARSHSLRIGWRAPPGGLLEFGYRTVLNRSYSPVDYQRAHEGRLRYTQPWRQGMLGGELTAGRDVFGDGYTRVGAFLQFHGEPAPRARVPAGELPASAGDAVEYFVDVGVNANRVTVDLIEEIQRETTSVDVAPHVALGVRRAVGARSDIGTRVELDDMDGNLLLAVRAIDYRYRFDSPLALGAFVGAARYDLATPAYGIYGGVGAQWRELLPNWDLGVQLRYAYKVARDNLLPEDPQGVRPDSFYNVASMTLSLSRRF